MRLADARGFDELDGTPGAGPLRVVGPHARAARPVDPTTLADRRRLRAVRHRPGARPARRAATASTTPCGSRARADRVDPADIRVHADRPRLRPRPRAPLGRGRHAARHRQPVDASCATGRDRRHGAPRRRRPKEHADDPSPSAGVVTIPLAGVPAARATATWFEELVDLGLHRRLVGGGRRRCDAFTPARARRGVGAARCASGRRSCPSTRAGPALLAQSIASLADAAPGRFAARHRLVART